MNALNDKINAIFPRRVVRKDLVQRVKKGTNTPTFVLEFLLARYCASDDPDEIETGLEAVNETLQGNFVRPNESNAAQSLVQQKGSHKYIDKVRARELYDPVLTFQISNDFHVKKVLTDYLPSDT